MVASALTPESLWPAGGSFGARGLFRQLSGCPDTLALSIVVGFFSLHKPSPEIEFQPVFLSRSRTRQDAGRRQGARQGTLSGAGFRLLDVSANSAGNLQAAEEVNFQARDGEQSRRRGFLCIFPRLGSSKAKRRDRHQIGRLSPDAGALVARRRYLRGPRVVSPTIRLSRYPSAFDRGLAFQLSQAFP